MEKGVEDKYPQDFRSAWEIARFATCDVGLGIDNYIQARKGDKARLEYVEPIAIKRLGCLMEDSALKYFESRNERGEGRVGFISPNVFEIMLDPLKEYCRTNKTDELMMQVYLGGKEFQRFEDFGIKKLEELRDFSIGLSEQARACFNKLGGFRRGLVA